MRITSRRDASGQGPRSPGEQRRFKVAACRCALGDGPSVLLELEKRGLLHTRMGFLLLAAKLQKVAP